VQLTPRKVLATVGMAAVAMSPAAYAATVPNPIPHNLDPGDKACAAVSPSVKVGPSTTQLYGECLMDSTVRDGFVAHGQFSITIRRGSQTIRLSGKRGMHCGGVGTIRKGDRVDAIVNSNQGTQVSSIVISPYSHC
jgi:hypothetical protein